MRYNITTHCACCIHNWFSHIKSYKNLYTSIDVSSLHCADSCTHTVVVHITHTVVDLKMNKIKENKWKNKTWTYRDSWIEWIYRRSSTFSLVLTHSVLNLCIRSQARARVQVQSTLKVETKSPRAWSLDCTLTLITTTSTCVYMYIIVCICIFIGEYEFSNMKVILETGNFPSGVLIIYMTSFSLSRFHLIFIKRSSIINSCCIFHVNNLTWKKNIGILLIIKK